MRHYYCNSCHRPLHLDRLGRVPHCEKKECRKAMARDMRTGYWEDENVDLFDQLYGELENPFYPRPRSE